jgi:hypothetical protein
VGNQCEAFTVGRNKKAWGEGRGNWEEQEGCDTCDGGEPYDAAAACARGTTDASETEYR